MDGASNPRDDVSYRLDVPVRLDLEMDFRRPGPDVIGDGERPAPLHGSERPGQGFEERLRVAVGDRERRDLRESRGLGYGQTLSVLGRSHAGGQWIAGIERRVHDASARGAVPGPHRSPGKDLASEVPIVARIGIDQAADGAMLGGDLRL